MGTVPHHRAKAAEYLGHADRAIASHDPVAASVALRRAASHAATALNVHYDCKHNSRRRLEFAIHVAIADRHLSRSHLKTFRQTYTLSQHLAAPRARHPAAQPARPEPVAELPTAGRNRPASGDSSRRKPESRSGVRITLRRMRRRVSALISSVAALLAGQPKPVRPHKLWQRSLGRPALPTITHVRDILNLPDYAAILSRFNLFGAPVAAEPDPHGAYDRGQFPTPCSCHRELWDKHEAADPNRFTMSPLWRHALEKTYRQKLPTPLILAC